MIDKICFKNYKSFKEEQTLELKPITLIIGKNSSGKSAVVKLPTLIEASLSGKFDDPLEMINGGVELGAEFRDLVYGREIGSLQLSLTEDNKELKIEVASGVKDTDFPKIRKWQYGGCKLIFDDKADTYYDEINSKSYNIQFAGFEILSGCENTTCLPENRFNLTTNYVGPFRELPDRTYNSSGNVKSLKVGNRGENTYQILINDYLRNSGQLLKQVSNWYEDNFEGWGIQINPESKPDFKVELTRKAPDFNINIRDVGEGMTQALPLVVSAFLKTEQDTLSIFEQPELHLHPAAHGNLAELFALSAKSSKRYLIETHSQNFVLRLRRLVAEKKLDKNDVALYSVEYNKENNTSTLKEIEISDDGSVSYWPENVFSETLDETIAIRTAQLEQQNDN